MSHVVLVTGPDPGHALVVLGLARALRGRGVRTTVATGTQHERLVRAEGHAFVPLPLLPPAADAADFGHLLYRRAGQMARPLVDRLAPLAPDLVVTDALTTVGAFAAELLDVDRVEVSPHHLMDPDPLVPPIGMGLPPSRDPDRVARDDRVRRAQARDEAAGVALRDEVRAGLGLGAWHPPVARLLQTLPGLEPPRRTWPADAHVVGQLAIDPDLPPLPVPPGDAPLVVVTDSSAPELPTPLGALAVEALRDAGLRLVVTSRQRPDVVWPGCVVGAGPHEPLLDRAALAVGPGGGGFVSKALSRGVPMVVVPIAGDQYEAAGRVAHAGAGATLDPATVTPARLRAAVLEVLADDRHAAAARRLAAGAATLGPAHAADLVLRVLAGDVPRASGP